MAWPDPHRETVNGLPKGLAISLDSLDTAHNLYRWWGYTVAPLLLKGETKRKKTWKRRPRRGMYKDENEERSRGTKGNGRFSGSKVKR